MSSTMFYALIVIFSVIGMEFMAYISHRFLMHGWLWSWHEDHHKPQMKEGWFEKNDLFFLVYAIPSMACYFLGSFIPSLRFLLFVGIGISIYGMIYFLIHDVYIHQRFKWFRQLDSKYSRAILRAHGDHHSNQEKEDGVSFGLLVINSKYFKKRSQWKKEKN